MESLILCSLRLCQQKKSLKSTNKLLGNHIAGYAANNKKRQQKNAFSCIYTQSCLHTQACWLVLASVRGKSNSQTQTKSNKSTENSQSLQDDKKSTTKSMPKSWNEIHKFLNGASHFLGVQTDATVCFYSQNFALNEHASLDFLLIREDNKCMISYTLVL